MQEDVIKVITDIEGSFDTDSLRYHGVSYWPLCRLRIWGGLLRRLVVERGAADPPALSSNTGPTWSDVGKVNAALAGSADLGLLAANAKPGFAESQMSPTSLFFVRPEEYSDKVAGKTYARFIDSVVEHTREVGPSTKVELADPRTMMFARRHPSLFVDLNLAGRNLAFDPPGELANFAAIARAVAARADGFALDQGALLTDMGKIFYFARIFEKLLRALKPRLFFLSVSYHPVGHAWMLACRRAGIRSVDLQHGRLGPIHGNYTHFTAAPAEGYDLLPDRVWCWGETTRRDIAQFNNPRCTRHAGVVGGNAWLGKWRYGNLAELEPAESVPFLDSTRNRPKILVSLQPYDVPIGAELIRAMKQSPPAWLWLLRVHPLRRQTAPELKAMLQNAGVANFEIEMATSLPLYLLLRHAVHHVTVFSSVVTEAAAFDLRTSLLGPVGASTFTAYVERGICRYTPSAELLNADVQTAVAGPRQALHDDFIDTGRGAPARALAELLA